MSKRIYDSAYGATRKLTAAERIAEIACERMAKKAGKGLRDRFWLDKEWLATFRLQQRHATTMIKAGYDPEAIFKVLVEKPWLFSLAHPRFAEFVDAKQREIDAGITRVELRAKPANPEEVPRVESRRPNLKQKLRGL